MCSLTILLLLCFNSFNVAKGKSLNEVENIKVLGENIHCGKSRMCISIKRNSMYMNFSKNIYKREQATPYRITIVSSCNHYNLSLVSYNEDENGRLKLCTEIPHFNPACHNNDEKSGKIYFNNFVLLYKNVTKNIETKKFSWNCSYNKTSITAKKVFRASTISSATQFLGNRTGEGRFQAAMFLYKDNEYRKVYSLSPVLNQNSKLRVRVMLVLGPVFTKLQIVRCWGTPYIGSSSYHSNEYVLIDNYCPAPEAKNAAKVSIISNGEHNYAVWESLTFRFVESKYLYLHCNVRVCFDNHKCSKNCSKTDTKIRYKRKISNDDVIVSVGPIRPSNNVMDIKISGNVAKDAYNTVQPTMKYKIQKFNEKLLFSVYFTIVGIPLLLVLTFTIITCLLCKIYKSVMESTSRYFDEVNNANSVKKNNETSCTFTTKKVEIPIPCNKNNLKT